MIEVILVLTVICTGGVFGKGLIDRIFQAKNYIPNLKEMDPDSLDLGFKFDIWVNDNWKQAGVMCVATIVVLVSYLAILWSSM